MLSLGPQVHRLPNLNLSQPCATAELMCMAIDWQCSKQKHNKMKIELTTICGSVHFWFSPFLTIMEMKRTVGNPIFIFRKIKIDFSHEIKFQF